MDYKNEFDLSTRYLTFQISGQYYGIPIGNVIEIVQVQPSTELPGAPYYMKGVINLRGRVIPLIDMNLRFGKAEQSYTDRTCVVIVDLNSVQVGFIVDAVNEVLDIDASIVSPLPSFSASRESRYITGVGKLEKHMILLLDCRLLLSDSEIDLIGEIAV